MKTVQLNDGAKTMKRRRREMCQNKHSALTNIVKGTSSILKENFSVISTFELVRQRLASSCETQSTIGDAITVTAAAHCRI